MKIRIYLFIILFIFQLNIFTVQSASSSLHSIIQHIKDFLSLKQKANDISSTILDNPQNASSNIRKLGVIDDVLDQVASLTGKITSLPDKISEKVEHDWEKVKETPKTAMNAVNSISETAETQVKNTGNTIKSKVSENASRFFKALKDAENKVSGEVNEAKQKTKDMIIQQVSNFVTGEIEHFTSLPKMTQERLVQLYQNKKNSIFNKTNEMTNNVKNIAWDGTTSILSLIKEVIFQASVLGVLFAIKVIFEVNIVIHLKPINITVGDLLSVLSRKKKGEECEISKENSSPETIKLKHEDFVMRCASVRAEKIPKDENLYLVKLFVHYEISYFQTTEGEVFLKFIVISSDVAKEAAVLKIPAEKFVEECITEGCLLETPVNGNLKSIDVRIRVGFKSNSGQYIALHSSDFKVALT